MADKEVPLIVAKKTPQRNVTLDPNGFFVIEVNKQDQAIRAEYYTNVYKGNKIVSGILKAVFIGKKADALCDIIAARVPALRKEHYMYIGRELQRAQCSLEKNKPYEQGGC